MPGCMADGTKIIYETYSPTAPPLRDQVHFITSFISGPAYQAAPLPHYYIKNTFPGRTRDL